MSRLCLLLACITFALAVFSVEPFGLSQIETVALGLFLFALAALLPDSWPTASP